MLQVNKQIGASLTENYAMTPASSVCGYYFNHQDAKYFTISKIHDDQVLDYARRKQKSVEDIKKDLAPLLS